METSTNIILHRTDLRKMKRELPIEKITIDDFKNECIQRIRDADMAWFMDNDEQVKQLK